MRGRDPILQKLVQRLSTHATMPDVDLEAIYALTYRKRSLAALDYLIRQGNRALYCPLLISGFTFRQKITQRGARQILSIQMPGDLIDLQNLFFKTSDHNIQALTPVIVADVPVEEIEALIERLPAIARAMWIDCIIENSILREWTVNIGRRDARARVAHFICELAFRLKSGGPTRNYEFDLPMTQEQIADALGLTPVHVNRVLAGLSAEGLIKRDKRKIIVESWQALKTAGQFSPDYLHLKN
jgi:CRP-like cAMP-binding protein